MADAAGNRYGPYDIEVPGSEAEALTEAAWFDLNGHITGVKSGGELTFAGLTATLTAIDARVHGSYLIREDPWSDASAPTATASPRRDMLVARRQRTSGEGEAAIPGKTFLVILEGAPAATPAEPTSFDPVDDEPLWSWQVPGGGGTVVTDVRDLRKRVSIDGKLQPITAGRTVNIGGFAIAANGSATPAGVGLTLPPLPVGHLVVVDLSTTFYIEGFDSFQNLTAEIVTPAGATLLTGAAGKQIGVSQLPVTAHTRKTYRITTASAVSFGSSYTTGVGSQRAILQREDWTAWL